MKLSGSKNRFVVAAMSHETNSFSPIATTLDQFGVGAGPYFGSEAFNQFRDTRTAMGAFIDLAMEHDAELITPIAAKCPPSGPVSDLAYETIVDAIIDGVSGGCDALFLELHGAMITESFDDGEGELLRRLRAIAPDLPIAVSLDFHANMTDAISNSATVLAAYKTYPHVDMYDTGRRAGVFLLDTIAGRLRAPTVTWGNVPMLPHTLRMDTSEEPMRTLIELGRQAERTGDVLLASVLGGFPLADTAQAGLSVVVMSDGDATSGAAVRDRLLEYAWAHRQELVYQPESLELSVSRARAIDKGPVLLIDHADNCNSGGTLDSMSVIREVVRQGLEDVAVGPVCDPEIAAIMFDAGVGAQLSVALGGKVRTPAVIAPAAPLELTGRVTAISDGQLVIEGPVFTGTRVSLGKTACLDTGQLQIVVTSRRMEPYDLGLFRCVGIEPILKRYIVLKSRIQYKPVYLPLANAVIECDGAGVSSSDYSVFRFQRLRRPIYPIDPEVEWAPREMPGGNNRNRISE